MTEVRQTEHFAAWLSSLRDARAKARIATRLLRLAAGLFGDVRPIGGGVSELRIDYGPGYRVYFVQRGETLLILLGGGDKASQSRDITAAKTLAEEV